KAIDYFKREDIKYVWTRGKEGRIPDRASVDFPEGQWSIMRSSYDEKPYENARHLVFKSSCGPHGHRDVLSITNYAYGRELLIDPGIRSYERADGQLYAQTSYHNTVTVDGKNSNRSHGKTERWVSNAGFDYVLGSHQGYDNLSHIRGIVFVKPDYWVVLDEIRGDDRTDHIFDQNWHFAENAGLVEDPLTKAVHTNYPKEQGDGYTKDGQLLMVPVNPSGLNSQPVEFYIATSRMVGGQPIKSKGWKYSRTGPPPARLDVVLYPYTGTAVPDVTVSRLGIEGNPVGVVALEIRNGDEVDYVVVSRTGAQKVSISAENLDVDAEVAVIRTRAGKPVRVSGANIRSVAIGGNSIFSAEQAQPNVDLVL
ncbi:MAG: heparinase II/III family protein, partial [Armatimonadota bacterium]